MVDLSQLQPIKTESDLKAELDRQEAIRYLTSTDWYVIRFIEVGKDMPQEIKDARLKARSILSAE